LHFELYSLDVLRVLSKKTIEINKDVRYYFVPDPSLAKVVKYSTLTILLLSYQFVVVIFGSKAAFLGFFEELGHTT
jgi:hypothetical protein